MKKFTLLVAALMMAFEMTAQWHPGAEININNVKTTLYGTGNFFRMRGQTEVNDYGYYVPSTGTAYTIFQNTLWIGGLDENDSLHVAAVRFNQLGDDFWSGPLRETDASTDIFTVMDYHHIWKVTRAEIEELIANPSGDIPEDILTWPAHGNVDDGFAEYMAPFVDVDYDGRYNPRNGDYPDILGDMALYCIYNDNYDYYNSGHVVHGETGGAPLGIEIHCMLYGFNAPDDEILNNTLFMRQWIYNRSANTYHDTYIGYWTDFDIGYAHDDYIGCSVQNSYYYGYNGNHIDGSGQPEAYGSNPPAQVAMILGGPTKTPDNWDNPKYDAYGAQLVDESINGLGFGDGIVDNERIGMTSFIYHNNTSAVNGDPEEPVHYYNLMQGKWINGQPVYYGGDGFAGHPGVVGPECKFMFPYDSDPYNWGTDGIPPGGGWNQNGYYWGEQTGNNGSPNAVGDRRGLASSGPFTFESGTMHVIDRAYVTVWFQAQFSTDALDTWATYIKDYFMNNLYDPLYNYNTK
ncbi:MAG: hypothetical protein SPK72_04270 [Bacteroidales bacterium]|nr:hypothetical protein [Bacteroidales bacterium]